MSTSTQGRPYKIDGYPVSRQELLDQGAIISGKTVTDAREATRILEADGREVTMQQIGTPISQLSGRPGHPGFDRFCGIAKSWGYD